MIVSVDFKGLRRSDHEDLERILSSIRRALADDPAGHDAANVLLRALDFYRAHGHRQQDSRVRLRLTSGLDPALEEHVRALLISMLQVSRDQDWLSDALRVWFNEVLIELVDDGRAAKAEADGIRRLMHSIPSAPNPKEAA